MQYGSSIKGKDATNGEHLNKHIYLHTYTVGMHVNQCSNGNHAVMYAVKESTHAIMKHVRDKPRAMQKSYYRLSILYTLNSSTYGHGATTFMQRNKGKTPGQIRGRRDLLGSL